LRPPRPQVDPRTPLGLALEEERRPGGGIESTATVFLAGAECPFTCVFCDLWKHTLDGPTPPGALPEQLRQALADPRLTAARPTRIKLYNASNFFDARAVPPADWPALAELLRPFPAVTVECHPRLVGPACLEFARLLDGRLEVAMGLESASPRVLGQLNKQMSLDEFKGAAAFLRKEGMDVRAFVLLGAPFVPRSAVVADAVRSAVFAAEAGATVVAIIPARGGNGEMERLIATEAFTPPTLRNLENALEEALTSMPEAAVVSADVWDAPALRACPECRDGRLARVSRMNLTGGGEAPIACAACATGA
jgi:radical SAM enzyme (TIGR01210 family)